MSLDSGKLTGYETVLTKPDLIQPTRETMGKLDRAQNKRRKTRKMTAADVAADLAELDREALDKHLTT